LPISDAPKDLENGDSTTQNPTTAQAGTAEYLIQLEERRSIKVNMSLHRPASLSKNQGGSQLFATHWKLSA
jgi:hypothetical protein